VVDDTIDHGEVAKEGDDLHRAPALGAEHRVDFIDLMDHLGPALRGDGLRLLLDHPEGKENKVRLLGLPPMGIGVQPVITDGDLALVGDVRGHPGDEFLAVDVEARMPPVQKPLCPLRAEELAVVLEIIKRYDAS